MKKGIKFLLISILVFTTFAGGVGFSYSAQADSSSTTLTPEQQKELRNGILSWYASKDYQHFPYKGTPVGNCSNDAAEADFFPSCICTGPTAGPTECWKWTCPSGKCTVADISGKEAITEHLETLTTYEDFAKEYNYIKYIQNMTGQLGLPASGGGIIDAIGAYLHNSDSKGELKKALDNAIDINEKVTATNFPTGTVFGRAIKSLLNALVWSMQPSTYGGYTTSNQGVVKIWKIMRNFVNIGLIIAMILMAMATILGIEKYSWKKVLWKIVVVALLVNFSLVIVGMIVDLFNYFTVYFLNSAKIAATNFGGISNFQGPTFGFWKIFGNFAKWLFTNLLMLFVGILVIIILLAALLAMIARAIVIMFLAAISPLAFAAWIFPDTEKWWKMWWDNFLKWASFGLLFSISLYVGMTIVSEIHLQPIATFDAALFTTLMAAIILLVGLIFSMQTGTAASKFILAQTGKASGAIGLWTGRKAMEKTVSSERYGKIASNLATSPKKLFRFTGLNALGRQMLRAKHTVEGRREKDIQQEIESAGGNPRVLDALFEQFKEPMAKAMVLAQKAEAQLGMTLAQIKFAQEYGSQHKGDPYVRKYYKYNPALRQNGKISMQELISRVTSSISSRDKAEKVGQDEILKTLQEQNRLTEYLTTTFAGIQSTKKLGLFIASIPPSDREAIFRDIIHPVLKGNLQDWLHNNNPNLATHITQPTTDEDLQYSSDIKRYWQI